MFTNPIRILRTAILHMQRHGWHTLAALSIMTLTFFMMSLFILILLASNQVLHYFETQPLVTVFFKDETTDQQIQSLTDELLATGNVKQIELTSKSDAQGILNEELKRKGMEEMLSESLPTVALPASISISANNFEDLEQVTVILQQEQNQTLIETVASSPDLIDRLSSIISTGRMVGIALVGFLLTISFLIMLVTIGLNIAAFQEEVEIMRLVGASNWYIRGPFIVEGVLYGTISAIIAVTIVYAALPLVVGSLETWLSGAAVFPIPVLPVFGGLLLGQILFGSILGILGSTIAMRRSLEA